MATPVIEHALKVYLLSKAAVTDKIAHRLYANHVPQDERGSPRVVLRRIITPRMYTLLEEFDCVQVRMSVDIYADGAGGERAVLDTAEQIRQQVSSYRGTWGNASNEAQIYSCTIERESTLQPYRPIDGSDVWTHAHTMELLITHNQDVPTW